MSQITDDIKELPPALADTRAALEQSRAAAARADARAAWEQSLADTWVDARAVANIGE